MRKESFDIQAADGIEELALIPKSDGFRCFRLPLPFLRSYAEEVDFQLSLQDKIQESCGNSTCDGRPVLDVSSLNISGVRRIVRGGFIICDRPECPLEDQDPPSSGDREPLVPLPPTPSLQATLNIQ